MNEATQRRGDGAAVAAGLGGLLVVVAALEASFHGHATDLGALLLVVGGGLVLGAATAERSRLATAVLHRSSLYGLNNVVLLATVALILVMVNLFAHRWSERLPILFRLDLTRASLFSLSPQTRQLLAGLDRDVRVTAFVLSGRGAGAERMALLRNRGRLERLLELYGAATPRLRWRLVDPELEPSAAERYGVSLPGTIVVEAGEQKLLIKPWSVFRPADPIRELPEEFTGEQALTNALLRLTQDRAPIIYLTTGHKERDFNDQSPAGATELAQLLLAEHYTVMRLNVLATGRVPADAACVVLAGPLTELETTEEQALSQYLRGGGNALIVVGDDPPASVARLVKPFGVRLYRNFVLDLGSAYINRPRWPIPTLNGHVITDEIIRAGRVPTFPNAAALDSFRDETPYVKRTIAQSSTKSWAEVDFTEPRSRYQADQDEMGPVTLAMAVSSKLGSVDSSHERARAEFRLVVVGCPDLLANRAIGIQANADFVLNSLAWVTGEADRITVRAATTEGERTSLSEVQGSAIFYATTLAMPALLLLAGLLVWLRRSNR